MPEPPRAVRAVVLVTTRAFAAPLHYLDDPAAPLPVGAVVRAPLGAREVDAVVVEAGASTEGVEQELRPVVDSGRRIPEALVALALELAARYATTPARTLALVLPPGPPTPGERWASLVPAGPAPAGTRQLAAAAALADGPLRVDDLRARAGLPADAVRRLVERGAVALGDVAPARALVVGPAPVPTPAQAAAIARVAAALEMPGSEPLLLHGVTGSGKTEVFLQAIQRVLERGRGAILLVPEIALAPQTAARVLERFGPAVAVIHSGLAPGARDAALRRLARGEARIAVGPRSAVLAPVPDLGLVVVDEEHDAAYKQDADPRYDARAAAVLRARAAGALALFASATPRPETWHALEHVTLPARVRGDLPPVDLVDLRRDDGYPLSHALAGELRTVERDGGRAILLLNRRGTAPALHCRSCGGTFRCRACDVALTLHRGSARLRCHHCGHAEPIPRRCPGCGAVDLAHVGAGTERLEEVVRERFPDLDVIRLDADVVAHAGALDAALDRFRSSERAVLLGTQMVAKGHDFPGVRIAAAIDADAGALVPDFRAEERQFALLTQLAGRAAREGAGGRVLLQTWDPGTRALQHARRHDVAGFLADELRRREALGYPPFRRLVRVLVAAPTDPIELLAAIAEEARPLLPGDQVLGPAPLVRLRNRERVHLLVKTDRARHAAAVLGELLARHARAMRRAGATSVVDVDPQSL